MNFITSFLKFIYKSIASDFKNENSSCKNLYLLVNFGYYQKKYLIMGHSLLKENPIV